NVIQDIDGHDVEAVSKAIQQAKQNTHEGPTLICCKTSIGKGSPNLADTAKVHGAPLGDDEIQATRQTLGWTAEPFTIPENIAQAWDHTQQGQKDEQQWQEVWKRYSEQYPQLAQEFERRLKGKLPQSFASQFEEF